MRAVAAVVLALALVVGGCSDDGQRQGAGSSSTAPSTAMAPSTATASAAWVDDAEQYLDGYLDAVAVGDVKALAYFAPDAVVRSNDMRAGPWHYGGMQEIERWLDARKLGSAGLDDPTFRVRQLFLGTEEAVALVDEAYVGSGDQVGRDLLLIHLGFGPDGITSHEEHRAGRIPFLMSAAAARRADAGGAGGWATAQNAAAEEALLSLYALYGELSWFPTSLYGPDATTVDSLRGTSRTVHAGDQQGVWPTGWVLRPTLVDDVAGSWPALSLDPPTPSVVGSDVHSDLSAALGWYTADAGDGCARTAMLVWSLHGGYPDPPMVTGESVLWDLDGLRRCGIPGGGPVPAGWWDPSGSGSASPASVPVPLPLDQRPTGTVTLPDGSSVVLANTDAELEDLVRWAFAQFTDAGLEVPHPVRVAFEPSEVCSEATKSGEVDTTPEGRVATICFRAGEGDTELARWFLLHELSHVWGYEHLDDAARQAFVAAAGLPAWDGASIAYDDRGIEAAANVMAWGLLGGTPVLSSRLDRWTCEQVVDLYRLLTRTAPLSSCPA